MAHWLKAAEGLFEVVDRRAKLVVGEQSDEQSNIQPPASNGQGSRAKRAKSKVKPQKRLSSNEAPTTADTALELTSAAALESEALSHKDNVVLSSENDGISPGHSSSQVSNEEQHTGDGDGDGDSSISVAPLCRTSSDNELRHDAVQGEVSTAVTGVDSVPPTSNGDLINETSSIPPEESSSAPLADEGIEVVQEVQSVDSSQNVLSEDKETTITIDEERSQSTNNDEPSNDDSLSKDTDLRFESQPDEKILHKVKPDTDVRLDSDLDKKKIQELKPVASPTKVQDQLDEAQGLLKSAVSTGQSKEARLARVCAGLSSRLQEYKSENSQLEELLVAERELSKSYEAHIQELQKDLSTSKNEVTRIESNMAEALAAKNSEIEALISSMDALKKQAALSEGNLAALQANMESIMRNRELTETRMMQALREELSSAERRAEEERAAHNATKMAAMEREVELEHRALDASTALARIQRTADERTGKAVELEQKVALLEVECASLNQELQDMEARVRRGQKKSPDEANQVIQMQAWQEEVERARQGQRDAESKLSSLEAEAQKLRVEMAAMKRDAEHYSRQEHMELEKRYRELTDLLYYKQTQLEAMTSEKAAAEFQLEKEKNRIQEAQVEVERSRSSRRASSSWEEDTDMKALEPLPMHHRHMVGASVQLQKAAKLLDSGAVRATRFLWRYPTARVLLLVYLLFVHLFLMYLLHRLQEQADTFASREVAESMGLANHTLQ